MSKKKTVKVSKTVNIKVARFEAHEMAFILVDNKPVYSGNYWDFHSGCQGTKIAGYELKGLWDQGIDSLGGVLKLVMEKEGKKVTLSHKKLNQQEYKALGY